MTLNFFRVVFQDLLRKGLFKRLLFLLTAEGGFPKPKREIDFYSYFLVACFVSLGVSFQIKLSITSLYETLSQCLAFQRGIEGIWRAKHPIPPNVAASTLSYSECTTALTKIHLTEKQT